MSWFDNRWNFREAVSIYNNSSNTTIDFSFSVSVDNARFWNNVQDNNGDVIVTSSDGQTALDFQVSTWDYANKSILVKVKGYALPNGNLSTSGKIVVAYLYWGFNDGTSNAVTSSSNANQQPLNNQAISATTVEIGNPRRAGAQVVPCGFEAPEQTEPASVVFAPPGVTTHLFFDATSMLATRRTVFNGARLLEEVDTALVEISDTNGNAQSSMVTESATRVLDPGIIRATIVTDANTVKSNFLVTLSLITDAGRVLKFFALLKVRKITAPTAS